MSTPHQVPSLKDLRKRRIPVRDVNTELAVHYGRLDRLAMWITDHVGTMGFFFVILGWTLTWLAWNTLGPAGLRFDPFPGFVLWLFISNMIQIFLMPLLLIGQNLQGRHAEVRAQSDYEVNVKAESEIDAILMHLENQNQVIEAIRVRVDAMGGKL